LNFDGAPLGAILHLSGKLAARGVDIVATGLAWSSMTYSKVTKSRGAFSM